LFYFKVFLTLAIALIASGCRTHDPAASASDVRSQRPWCEDLNCLVLAGTPLADQKLTLLVNSGYVVGYDEKLHAPIWVSTRVGSPVFPKNGYTRWSKFLVDKRVSSRTRPDWFRGSGYARGHLAPSFGIYSRYGAEAEKETFLLSNVVAQNQILNTGRWQQLERMIASDKSLSWTSTRKELWVIAGAIFSETPLRIREEVAVPEALYKIVCDVHEGSEKIECMAFVFPNEPAREPLKSYLVSISSIEARTGLKFFPQLNREQAQRVKSEVSREVWPIQ